MRYFGDYIKHRDSNILGCYSDERLNSTKPVKCPWGAIPTDPTDPGHKTGKGLFHRNGYEYPTGAIHVGLWKFEEAEDYEYLIGNQLIGFEANPHTFEHYSSVTCDLYGFQSYNLMLGEDEPLDESFLFAPHNRPDTGGRYGDFEGVAGMIYHVPYSSLDACVRVGEIPTPNTYNFLNIDAEGSELDILKGGAKLLESIDYIVVETSYNDRFNSGSTLEEIERYLLQWDFQIVEIDGNFLHSGWGDVFIAKDGLGYQ